MAVLLEALLLMVRRLAFYPSLCLSGVKSEGNRPTDQGRVPLFSYFRISLCTYTVKIAKGMIL